MSVGWDDFDRELGGSRGRSATKAASATPAPKPGPVEITPTPAPRPEPQSDRQRLRAEWLAMVASTGRDGDLVTQVRALGAAGVDAAVPVELLQEQLISWVVTHQDHGELEDPSAAYAAVGELARAYRAGLHGRRVVFRDVHTKGQRKGKPISHSLRNIRALLEAYRATCRYNTMTHRLELDSPAIQCADERRANHEITWWRHLCDMHGLAKDQASEYLGLVADEYHPVREWITAQTWDGQDRVSAIIDTIDTDDELAPVLVRRWLLQCVAAVSGDPTFRPAGVLVLQGPQGCGKTTWCSRLVPADKPWAAIGMHLDPTNRDDVQAVTRYWIAELGELDATFRKADVAALKAFVDRDKDVYRAAYARREEEVRRRTVLFASVNRPDFLADDTGNRRWWTVRVRSCEWRHGIDLAQLWAQLWHDYHAGADYRLTDDELHALNQRNVEHELHDPLADDLFDTWEPIDTAWEPAPPSQQHTLRQVVEALPEQHRTAQVYTRTCRQVAKLLRQAGATEGRVGKGRALGFLVRRTTTAPMP